jgi:hypothetical protein
MSRACLSSARSTARHSRAPSDGAAAVDKTADPEASEIWRLAGLVAVARLPVAALVITATFAVMLAVLLVLRPTTAGDGGMAAPAPPLW